MRRLRGGTSAAVHLVRVRDRRGDTRSLVLRRFVRADWLTREPDLAAREARALDLLASSDVAAPRLVAVDATGAECHVPAVLMARLPGRVDVAPTDTRRYVRAIAEQLPAVHAIEVPEGVPPYYPYFEEETEEEARAFAWSRRPESWRAALGLVSQDRPPFQPSFIHRDFHPGNVLWSRGRVSGVIDWVNASVGPRDVDASHCAVNIAELFGVRAATRFREAYEAAAGVRQEPFWDLVAAVDRGEPTADQWRDAGRTDLTDALMLRRREAYLESVLRRLR